MAGKHEASDEKRPQDIAAVLAAVPLFAGIERKALAAIAAEFQWFSLPGGAELFRQGDAADGFYVVLSGCLGAFAEAAGGASAQLGRIPAGECVGEMALLSGKRRSASVRALRDSELVHIGKSDFDRLLQHHPAAMLHVARLLVRRLEQVQDRRAVPAAPRSFAVLPHGPEVPHREFAIGLAEMLARFGRTRLVTADESRSRTSEWFHRLEESHDALVYDAGAGSSAWARLCLRQADCLLLLASAGTPPSPWQALQDGMQPDLPERAELVLLHRDGRPNDTAGWLALHPVRMHHHLRRPADVQRLARLLTGRAVGLVLSGGGARGFAHIGVIKALSEAGVPIDMVGGTSMGAIIGAGLAAGWDHRTVQERYRRAFFDSNPLSDVTLPLVSLVAGRKVTRLLQDAFGDLGIEDLWLPFFCVTTNLTRGRAAVHRRGLLWRWLRASVAIPGVLPPIIDAGEVHVDGGVINNLPIDAMRAFARGPIIGVDVTSSDAFTAESDEPDLPPLWRHLWRGPRPRQPNILQLLWRAGTVNSDAAVAAFRDQTDLLLQPPLEAIDLLSWRAFDRAVEAGYRYAAEQLDRMPRPLASEVALPVI